MKKLYLFLAILIFVVGFSFFENLATTQEKSSEGNFVKENNGDCICVRLISEFDKYELKRNNPIPVVVRIKNKCTRKIELKYYVFELEKISINEADILGNYYRGRLPSEETMSKPNITIEKDGFVEFNADIADLRIKDSNSSIDSWVNIFVRLKKGDYYLHSDIFVDVSNDNEERKIENFSSNKLTISYK